MVVLVQSANWFLAANEGAFKKKKVLGKLSPLHYAITLSLTNGFGGLTKFFKSNLFT